MSVSSIYMYIVIICICLIKCSKREIKKKVIEQERYLAKLKRTWLFLLDH